MCTRPCLFFAAGQCQNKDSCEFCHLPHNRRPTHLDKRNRELLKSFSSEETLATILPILSEKLQKYYSNSSALQLLMELEALSANSNADILESMSTTSSKQIARGERTLKSALRAVTLRSLLTLLLRTLPKDGEVRNVVEAIISSLRQPVQLDDRLDVWRLMLEGDSNQNGFPVEWRRIFRWIFGFLGHFPVEFASSYVEKIGFICHFNGQSLKEIGTCRWLHGQWGREVDLALGSWKKQTHYLWGDNFPQGYLENLYEEKIAKPWICKKHLQRIAW